MVEKDDHDWDCLLSHIFAVWEFTQASTELLHFKLVYGQHQCVLMDVASKTWEQETTPYLRVVEQTEQIQAGMAHMVPIVSTGDAHSHLQATQGAQRQLYKQFARVSGFHPGDRVLVLVPTVKSNFLAKL